MFPKPEIILSDWLKEKAFARVASSVRARLRSSICGARDGSAYARWARFSCWAARRENPRSGRGFVVPVRARSVDPAAAPGETEEAKA